MAGSKRRGFLGLLTGAWTAAREPAWRVRWNPWTHWTAASIRSGSEPATDFLSGQMCVTRREWARAQQQGLTLEAFIDARWQVMRGVMLDRAALGWDDPK